MKISKKLKFKRHCNHIVGLFSSVKYSVKSSEIVDGKGKLHFIRNWLHLSVISYTHPQLATLCIENNEYRKFKNLVATALKRKNYTSSVIGYTHPQSTTLHPQLATLLSVINYTSSAINYTCLSTSTTIEAKIAALLKLLQNLLKISTKVRGINT